jgi:hypothetical protein
MEENDAEYQDSDQEGQEYNDLVIPPNKGTVVNVVRALNDDGTYKAILKATRSDFVASLLYLNGKPFSFKGRDYLQPVYNKPSRNILLKTARQVEKSTFLGNYLVINSTIRAYNKALYVAPSHSQTRQFSNEKLRPSIEESPLIKKYLQSSYVSTQVFEKSFTNGSIVFLRSAFRSADRTRGISARDLMLDELQDFMGSEIPVIMECTSHFEDASLIMAGTPKSFDNPIESYWQESSQNEWLVKCRSCNHYNFLDEKNIAQTEMYTSGRLPPGPICSKCFKPIDVPKWGQWMSLSPGKRLEGYRIPQLMVPWIISTMGQWERLLWKRDNYPLGQFYNEVLGLSYDSASKPVSRQEIINCCDASYRFLSEFPDALELQFARQYMLTAGVDWGEGNDGAEKSPSGKLKNASYTVFTVGAYVDQKRFKVFFAKRYTGSQTDPEFIVRDIARIVQLFGIRLVAVDWGHGWGVNNTLVRMLGANKVMQFQYVPKQKEKKKWDPIGFKFQVQRNLIISEMIYSLKNQEIIFPSWAQTEVFAKDILAVYVEYREYQREMKYDHKISDPDDFLHSLIYARLASNIFLGRE